MSLEEKILKRIYSKGRGCVFFRNDFADLGSTDGIDKALYRLEVKGITQRIMRGLYYYPKYSKLLEQELSPEMDQVAQALARKFGWKVQVSGNTALYLLGLSTQVPTKYLYLCDGKTKSYKIGATTLEFKKAALKDMGLKYSESALVLQAIKALDKRPLTEKQKKAIRRYFSSEKHSLILKDTRYTTSWVYEIIKSIFKEDS